MITENPKKAAAANVNQHECLYGRREFVASMLFFACGCRGNGKEVSDRGEEESRELSQPWYMQVVIPRVDAETEFAPLRKVDGNYVSELRTRKSAGGERMFPNTLRLRKRGKNERFDLQSLPEEDRIRNKWISDFMRANSIVELSADRQPEKKTVIISIQYTDEIAAKNAEGMKQFFKEVAADWYLGGLTPEEWEVESLVSAGSASRIRVVLRLLSSSPHTF